MTPQTKLFLAQEHAAARGDVVVMLDADHLKHIFPATGRVSFFMDPLPPDFMKRRRAEAPSAPA